MKDSVLLNESVIQRSSISSIVVTVVVYIINTLLPNVNKDSYVFDFVFNVVLTYVVDILFVQLRFNKNNTFVKIPYDDIYFRLKYLFNISIFYKFIVVITIGSLINRSLFKYTVAILDTYKLIQKPEHIYYRNLLINIVINFFTTLMLLNFIKFKWAYIDCNDTYLSLIILSLFSLSILISVTK